MLALSLASSTPICVSDDSFPCNRITLFNTILSDVVLTELVCIFSNLLLLRDITAGDKVEFFYAWRKDGDKGVAAGANERSEELIQSMDMDVCEATSEEDCEPESELDSDEISEDEDDYGRQ